MNNIYQSILAIPPVFLTFQTNQPKYSLYSRNRFSLKTQNPSLVIYASRTSSMPDCPVKRHNRCHRTINLFRRFLLIRLDIPCRVCADENIIHHPPQHRMPSVCKILFQCQLHQPFGQKILYINTLDFLS